MQEAELTEIVILGDDDEFVARGEFPDLQVGLAAKPDVLDVPRRREGTRDCFDQPRTQILVEEEFHAAGELPRRRSRAAAKDRTARMSSRTIEGKSARIWSSVIPPARYSRMS